MRDILLLGDPALRVVCEPVRDFSDRVFIDNMQQLISALDRFRQQNGFGRGIATPQIGILKRFIALNLGHGTQILVNPSITWRSAATFTLWDDCMSFPALLVKAKRYQSISLSYSR